MSEVTFSPIPYNGGTLYPGDKRHFCRMTNNRFFCIYAQSNPTYTFGMIVNIDDLKAASPVSTILRTQAIENLTPTYNGAYRVVRLNDTDVAVFYNSANTTITVKVIRIDAGTNVMTVVGNTLSRQVLNSTGGPGGSIGNNWVCQQVLDNVVMTGTYYASKYYLDRWAWNPTTLTLTQTQSGSINSTFLYAQFVKVRGSINDWVLGLTDNSFSNPSFSFYMYGDVSTTTPWAVVDVNNTNAMPGILPYTTTQFLLIINNRRWQAYSNTSHSGTQIIYAPLPDDSTHPTWFTTWLNDDYFMVRRFAATSPSSYPTTGGCTTQIVRYTEPTYGDEIQLTSAHFTDFVHDFTSGVHEFVDNDIVLFYGRNNTDGGFKLGIEYMGAA